uniref:Uncharacterized protein n=1 Tax=Dunaliella tertiolecta TaxID=3047 RepID=A0A7S3VRP4_DUNTE
MPSSSDDRGSSPWKSTPANSTPESTHYAQGPKRNPLFQQVLHQPMPLSPRSGRHTRKPQRDQHQHQEHELQISETESLKPDPSQGCSGSTKPVGLPTSRTSPVPGKASPVSLPDIHEHPKHSLSPSGSRTEEGSHTPQDEGPHGLGTKILLESRGSLARFVRVEPLEPVMEYSEVEPDLPPRKELSSAEQATLAHSRDLEERRKALAMVAFVRHSTADMQAAAKLAAAHSKAGPHPHPLPSSSPISLPAVPSPHPDPQHPAPHQQQHPHLSHPQHKDHAHGWMDGPRAFSPPAAETWRHSTELPGSLYGLSLEFEGATGPQLADSQWPPQLPSTPDYSNGQQQAFPALQLPHIAHPSVTPAPPASNLNGIGHPVISKDAEVAKALLESHQIGSDYKGPLRSTKLSKLRKTEKQQHEDDLDLHQGKGFTDIRQILASETFAKRGPRHLTSKETLPRARKVNLPNPADQSSTTYWKGKRLNQLEKKVDSRLYQLRSNRSAKADLLERVNAYVAEKEAMAAEDAALALFANERREQRTILFMQRQARMSNKSAEASRGPPQRQATSLHLRTRSVRPLPCLFKYFSPPLCISSLSSIFMHLRKRSLRPALVFPSLFPHSVQNPMEKSAKVN